MELARAQESYANWGSVTGLANCLLWTAACLTRTGQSDEALLLLSRAYGMFDESGDRFGRASVLREQGIAFVALKSPAEGVLKLADAEREFLVVGNEVEALASAVLGAAAGRDRRKFLAGIPCGVNRGCPPGSTSVFGDRAQALSAGGTQPAEDDTPQSDQLSS